MKILMFILFTLTLQAQIVRENGECYEQRGKIYFIVPCQAQEAETPPQVSSPNPQSESIQPAQSPALAQNEKCQIIIGQYKIEYTPTIHQDSETLECEGAKSYIKSMNLGYEESLSEGKKKLGDLRITKGFSLCNIELYYGEYITVGIMSGEENMCNDFMVYHTSVRE